ncbi:hypothetical protein [Planococcus lenghuensis]|uniref:Uncharacterized protein n=1 Tax=Planococcus lenghuensis TaxID=2213202 RepID=A0A1Q2KVS2_9BACL|nr:hypothetical protein [Planococcus lenghuensis]AQQ52289.1 hypothetical protein B0X71_03630 [Planococcus lenghuensis]
MAPKEPREPVGNRPNPDSPYKDTSIDKLMDATHGLFVDANDDDDRENPNSKDKRDDFYKPFQHEPGTGRDDTPAEDEAFEDLADSKRHTKDTDADRDRDY